MTNKFPSQYLPNSIVNPLLNESIFIYQFHKASQRLKEKLNQAIKEFHVISVQFAIMYVIDHKKTSSQKELGEELGIDKASMVKFLDALEALNYVSRCEDKFDRRVKLISLTARGKQTIKKMDKIREQVENDFLAEKLSPDEIKTIRELFKKLR